MAGDIYWDKVVLAMHMDGANNSTAFTDATGKTIAAVGNAKISTTQSKFGGASGYFDGAGDYLTLDTYAALFPTATDDFTVEFFMNVADLGNYMVFCACQFSTGGGIKINMYNGGIYCAHGNVDVNAASAGWTATVWHHVAFVKYGDSYKIFLNGTSVATGSGTPSAYAVDRVTVAGIIAYGSSNNSFNGYIDDLRITKGVARYTANFTPPTAAFLDYAAQIQGTVKDANGNFAQRLVRAHQRDTGKVVHETLSNPSTGAFTLNTQTTQKHYAVIHDNDSWVTYLPFNGANDSTLFYEYGGKSVTASGNVKISTTQSKFGGAAAYFDGAGDFLTFAAHPDFAFGTADFTVEGWVYLSSLGVERAVFDNRAATTDTGIYFYISAANQLAVFGNNALIATGTTALTATAWHHVALVKSSGTVTLYLNGAQVASAASAYTITCPGSAVIGRKIGSTTNDFYGYLDDLKISKGKAQYTSAFLVPTQPHFTVSGDYFVQANAQIYDYLQPV